MTTTSSNLGEVKDVVIDDFKDATKAEEGNEALARRRAYLRDRHWTMLILATVALLLSFLLSFEGDGPKASLSLGSVSLPPMCGSRVLFGINCPGCGLTRSYVAIASGDLTGSLQFHRIGWLMWLATVLQLPYRVFCLRELRGKVVERKWPIWFGNMLIAALIGNWLLLLLGL